MLEGRHILMATFQGGGNIPLLLPIVTRLVARGRRVRILVGPGVRRSRLPVSESLWQSLHATGAEILRLREPAVHPWDAAPSAQGLLFGWTPRAFRSVAQEARAQLWLPHWANEVAAELRRAPADVLVADFVLVGALVAAEAVGVPTVVLFHAVYPRPVPGRPPTDRGGRQVWVSGGASEMRLARSYLPPLRPGRPPDREPGAQACGAASAALVFRPIRPRRAGGGADESHFDYPTQRMPPNVRLVGTPLDEVAPTPWDPPWNPAERQPRLLVSLSTR